MTRTWKKLAALAAAGALALSACSGSSGSDSDDEKIRIGVLLSLTGPAAPFGIPEKEAVEIAADEVNANGGINGREVELIIRDDKTDPTEAAKLARELMLDEEVVAIVGATIGSATLAAGPIAAANKVPMVAPNGTIEVTDPENDFAPWIYRSSVNDRINIENMVETAQKVAGPKLAVFYQEDAYGETSLELAKAKADEDPDLEITTTASAPLSATDVAAQAARLKNSDPDAILVQVSAPALGGAVVRGLRQVKFEGEIFVAGGLTSQPFLDAADGTAEGVHAVGSLGLDKPAEGQQKFIDLLKEAGHGEPSGFAEFIGAGAFNAIAAAAESIDGEITGEAMKKALDQTCWEALHPGPEPCYSEDNHDGMTSENTAHVQVVDGVWTSVG